MVLVTVLGVLAYRVGAHVPLPGVSLSLDLGNGFLRTASLLSGATLSQATVFGLGVMPYIMAQIVMQILQTCIPSIKAVAEDGVAGRNRVTQWTRRLAIPFAMLYAALYLWQANVTMEGVPGLAMKAIDGVILVGGAMMVMRIGELVDEGGLGQGMSVLICASILSGIPSTFASASYGSRFGLELAVALVMFAVTVPVVVRMERTTRDVAVAYARESTSPRVNAVLPIRLVIAGVVPVIFASMVVALPSLVLSVMPDKSATYLTVSSIMSGYPGLAAEFVLIVAFSLLYVAIGFDCDMLAKNMAQSGAYVTEADVKPGDETADYLRRVSRGVTVPGGFLMAVVACVPTLIGLATGNSLVAALGGTSLVIVADTVMQVADAVRAERAVASKADPWAVIA